MLKAIKARRVDPLGSSPVVFFFPRHGAESKLKQGLFDAIFEEVELLSSTQCL